MEAVLDAVIYVYTFKEGLLSKLAHDLQLKLTRFEIEATKASGMRAEFDAASLEVVGMMRDGKLETQGLGRGDKEKILANAQHEVLRTSRHPKAWLTGKVTRTQDSAHVEGTLELCGVTQPLSVTLRPEAGRLRGELELCPSRFGIKPFRALGGALKVQDRVRIAVDACDPGAAVLQDTLRWQAR